MCYLTNPEVQGRRRVKARAERRSNDHAKSTRPSPTSMSAAKPRLSARGASKGGRARASVLTPEERSEIARRAVQARWMKAGKARGLTEEAPGETPQQVEVGGPEELPYSMFAGPLTIGDVTFECHVLSNRQRVLTQREVVRVLSGGRDSGNLTRYLERNPLYKGEMLDGRTVQFRLPGSATLATGYDAEILVEICELYLDARAQKLLRPQLTRIG